MSNANLYDFVKKIDPDFSLMDKEFIDDNIIEHCNDLMTQIEVMPEYSKQDMLICFETIDDDGSVHMIADNAVHTKIYDLTSWVNDDENYKYVNEAVSDFGFPMDNEPNVFKKMMQYGMFYKLNQCCWEYLNFISDYIESKTDDEIVEIVKSINE